MFHRKIRKKQRNNMQYNCKNNHQELCNCISVFRQSYNESNTDQSKPDTINILKQRYCLNYCKNRKK